MGRISLEAMKAYLNRSISSMNSNKLNGLLAEIDFRKHLTSLGFGERVSPGGWIARTKGPGIFGSKTVAFFPETILPAIDYPSGRELPVPRHGLHTICATFHQSGISGYSCSPVVESDNNVETIKWQCVQLGLPQQQQYQAFPDSMVGFTRRGRKHNFLCSHSDVAGVPDDAVPDEFTKEHLRVTFQNRYMAEVSDIDGILWGNQYTYPVEIKEKTPATDADMGEYFGLDVGPFVKLAFYAAKRGTLHSIFVVREVSDQTTRNLVAWWYITFERLAQYASWVMRAGGKSMTGGRSAVVRIPKCEFTPLTRENLMSL